VRVFITDKEFLKQYVRAKIGDEFNIPTIAVLKTVDETLSFNYPETCIIKPTHASGMVIIRRNGEAIDFEKIKGWFATNYYLATREANYKNLKPKVIVEPLVFGSDNPNDYKIFCINGVPKLIQVDLDRHTQHKRTFYSSDWVKQPFSIIYPEGGEVEKPQNLDSMLKVAASLSEGFSLIRVDLYSDGEKVYVGELTNCSEDAGGFFIPASGESIATKLLFGDTLT
jgi:hypothetical protein